MFVHIGPDEVETRRAVPGRLLFPAPGRPAGHLVMRYDEQGRCPMLGESGCTIYEHRPRTCRTYDCRVFPAAGLSPGGGDEGGPKAPVARQAARWRFAFPGPAYRAEHAAVRRAAAFLREHGECLPGGRPGADPTRLAVLAVEASPAFLGGDPPDVESVRVVLSRRFSRTSAGWSAG